MNQQQQQQQQQRKQQIIAREFIKPSDNWVLFALSCHLIPIQLFDSCGVPRFPQQEEMHRLLYLVRRI